MAIRITSIEEANCITKSGYFFADRVLSAALLDIALPEVNLALVQRLRMRDINHDTIVFGIGRKYDPDQNFFDHSGNDFNETYDDGTKLSTFGLLWRKFGKTVLRNMDLDEALVPEVYNSVVYFLVMGVDARANNQLPKCKELTIYKIVNLYCSQDESNYTYDSSFIKAVMDIKPILRQFLEDAIARAKNKSTLSKLIANATDGIMVLPHYIPWNTSLERSSDPNAENILYVVYPSDEREYIVECVRIGNNCKKPLPNEWAGLGGSLLANASGVQGAKFCYNGGYKCSARTQDAALQLAKKAINS